jgi:multimeric flavodoxin WrbA
MAVVGISGSPIVKGNTDRMIQALLDRSGKERVFVNLSTLRFDPCRACAHLCAKSNMCGRKDELHPYLQSILDAEALVLGTPVHHGTMTAWMFGFLSRLWCFHHVRDLLCGKPVLLVVTALSEEGGRWCVRKFVDQLQYANSSQAMSIVGDIIFCSKTPPCYKCGEGSICKVGGLFGLLGRDEEKLRQWKLEPDMFKQWEDCPATVAKVDEYAAVLRSV